jgi:RNA polymerase-binding transcription factor DksA
MKNYVTCRRELLRAKARLQELLMARRASARTHGSSSVQDAFSNSGDSEFGDSASDLYDQELDVSLIEKYRHRLKLVTAALERIEDHTYGTCVRCHQRVPRMRLEAIPETPFCFACETEVEVQG